MKICKEGEILNSESIVINIVFIFLIESSHRPDDFFFSIRTFGERLGIVFTDDELWESQKSLSVRILRTFGFGKSDMMYNIQSEAQSLIRALKGIGGEGVAVQEENKNIFDIPVVNVIWKMIKGERFDLDDEKANHLMETIHKSFSIVDMSGGVLSFFPSLRHFLPNHTGYQPLVDTMKVLWDFLGENIDEVWNNFESGKIPQNFIEFYINENFHDFNKKTLLALLVDFFQAGSETTSNTLSFAFLYMLHYPAVRQKAQNEIDEKLKGKFPSLNDRNILKYTEAVLCEIQRMSNVAPLGIAHRALADVELDSGIVIPKNTTVLFSIFSVHMDEGYWGDPLVFRPERFLDGDETISHEGFMPFGAGKRRCVGENLARSSLFIFFVALLQEFDISSDDSNLPDLEGRNGITLAPKTYKLIFQLRKN